MGEIRNARCLLLQWQWIQYGDQQVDPICRSLTGSITPITTWILYADQQVDPLGPVTDSGVLQSAIASGGGQTD